MCVYVCVRVNFVKIKNILTKPIANLAETKKTIKLKIVVVNYIKEPF